MRTDNRIDLTPDPEVEDALRQLYASRESLVDLTSAERILDRAREVIPYISRHDRKALKYLAEDINRLNELHPQSSADESETQQEI